MLVLFASQEEIIMKQSIILVVALLLSACEVTVNDTADA